MSKILILGGAGYIGTRLYSDLTPQHTVEIVDLCIYPNTIPTKVIAMDYAALQPSYIQEFDVVILLAGYSSIAAGANSNASGVIENNYFNFVTLLDKLSPTQKFIYASSAGVYDGLEETAVTETALLKPASNLYTLTKKNIDEYIRVFNPKFEWYSLRMGTVNGFAEHVRSDIMINMMFKNAKETGAIKVMSPENRRPILFIEDFSDAVRAIIESSDDNRGIYNLVSFNSRVIDNANAVVEVTGAKIDIVTPEEYSKMMGSPIPKTLDFSISSEKFKETFEFDFHEEPIFIVDDLNTNYDKIKVFSARNPGFIY